MSAPRMRWRLWRLSLLLSSARAPMRRRLGAPKPEPQAGR